MHRSSLKLWLLLTFVLAVSGCVEKKPPAPAQSQSVKTEGEGVTGQNPVTEPKPADNQPADVSGVTSDPAVNGQAGKNAALEGGVNTENLTINASAAIESDNAAASPKRAPRPFDEAAMIASDPVGVIVVHPKQFFASPLGQLLREFNIDRQPSTWTTLVHRMNLSLAEIERITIVMDQSFVNSAALEFGVPVLDVAGDRPRPRAQLMALRQIGLAFHNYHDVFNKFPPAEGKGQKKGLSWRVHILQYLDQGQREPYEQFHLDEDWDSDHNRQLIAKMPDIFKSPGVTEEGKTAFHVFTGDHTAFVGDRGPSIRDITDGTSNTILVAVAGSDTAEFWTKPGGLEVDLAAPKKALGKLDESTFLALKFDGSVSNIPSTIDDLTLSHLIQPADGTPVDIQQLRGERPALAPPALILRLTQVAHQAEMIKGVFTEPMETKFEGQTIYNNGGLGLWFPDDRTVAVGSLDSLKGMVSAARAPAKNAAFFQKLHLDADLTAVFDLESQSALIREIAKQNPLLGMISNIQTVAVHGTANLEDAAPLIDVDLKTPDPQMATGLSTMAEVGLKQLRQTYQNHPLLPTANDSDREMRTLINRLLDSAKLVVDGDQIQFRVISPPGFDRLPALLRPNLAPKVDKGVNPEK